MRVHPLLLQQVLLLVVHATSGVHQLGEVLQLVLLKLLAWVGGAWRGREGQGLGSFGRDLGLSTMSGVLSAPRGHGVCIDSSTNLILYIFGYTGWSTRI